MIGTNEMAELLETSPKMLRRYLRDTNDFHAQVTGGRYEFKKKHVKEIQKGFQSWVIGRSERRSVPRENPELGYLDEDQGLPVETLQPGFYVMKAEREIRRRNRQKKLDQRLRECGIHLEEPRMEEADDAVHSDF